MGLEKALKDYGKHLNAYREAETKKEALKKREKEIFWNNEEKNYGEKLTQAKEIYKWAKAFTETKEYKEIIKHFEAFDLMKLGGISEGLIIHNGGWGHKHKDSRGCWSRIYLNQNGTLNYKAWYKWLGITTTIKLKKPSDLAEKLNQEYINELYKTIKTGEIIKTLDKEIKEEINKL